MDFADRDAKNPLGRIVKRADLLDNMDTTRLGEVAESDPSRLDRYAKAVDRLGGGAA